MDDVDDDGVVNTFIHDTNGDGTGDPEYVLRSQLVIRVGATSNQLYDYWAKEAREETSSSSIVNPSLPYSNITNGIGVFGGLHLKTFRF